MSLFDSITLFKQTDYIEVKGAAPFAILRVAEYPEIVHGHFLGFINRHLLGEKLEDRCRIRKVFHHIPTDFPKTWMLNNKMRRLEESIKEQKRLNQESVTHQVNQEDVQALENLVALQNKRILALTCLVVLHADDVPTLKKAVHKLVKETANHGVILEVLEKQQQEYLAATLLTGGMDQKLVDEGRLTDAEVASKLYPFDGAVTHTKGIYVGNKIRFFGPNNEVRLGKPSFLNIGDPNYTGDTNMLVVMKTGEGKSYFIKSATEGLLEEGYRVFVFCSDGENRPLCMKVNGDWRSALGLLRDPLWLLPPIDHPSLHEPGNEYRLMLAKEVNSQRLKEAQGRLLTIIGLLSEDFTPRKRNAALKALFALYEKHGVDREDEATWCSLSSYEWYELLCGLNEDGAKDLAEDLWSCFEVDPMFQRTETVRDSSHSFVVYHIANSVNNQEEARNASLRLISYFDEVWHEVVREKILGIRYTAVVLEEGQRTLEIPVVNEYWNGYVTTFRKFNSMSIVAMNKTDILFPDLSNKSKGTAGSAIWQNSSIKVFGYMMQSSLDILRERGNIHDFVIDRLSQFQGSNQLVINYQNRYDFYKLSLPAEEDRLYETRGLRKADES